MNDTAKRISQVQSLENGKGLQYLINKASEIMKNPLVLFNMEYELLYCAENVITDDRLWNEIVGTGIFSNETIKFFMEECFIDVVACADSIALLKSEKLKYDRLYGRIFNNYNNTVADLIMVACDKPFEEEEAKVFEVVCEKLSQEIGASDFFRQYGVQYNEKLICKLIDADIGDKIIYSGHVSNLYEGLKENLFVVVVDIGECNTGRNVLEETRDLFKKTQPEFKYAVYSSYIVIIVGIDETSLNIERDLNELSKYFNDNNIHVGISSCFENLFNLRMYYHEALDSLILNQI